MRYDKRKPVSSSFLIPQMATLPPKKTRMPEEIVFDELDAALEAGDDLRVLELLDNAPYWMKRLPEIILMRASVLISLDRDQESRQLIREIERQSPWFTDLHLPLSMFCKDHGRSAHALKAARRALSDCNLVDEDRTSLDVVIEEATAIIYDLAAENGLSFETMRRAFIFHEQAQRALDEGKLLEVEHLSKEAVKIAPNWNPPHNTRAFALYFLGKTSEAITVSKAVLTREAKNFFALRNLVTYHLGLDQLIWAQVYATRLSDLSENYPPQSLEIEEIISTLALLGDTPALWTLARRYLEEPSETLSAHSWYCLAVAAIRSVRWKDALQLMKKAEKDGLTPPENTLVNELEACAVPNSFCLTWTPPAYPGVDQLLHPKVIAEWDALLKNFNGSLPPSQKHKLDIFLQKFPFMEAAMKHLLLQEDTHEITAGVLLMLETRRGDGEIYQFALGKIGSRTARLNAILAFIQTGRYFGTNSVGIWNEGRIEWTEVELNNQRIGNIKVNAQPQTLALIEKANTTQNPQEGIALLEKAIEMEPTSPIAFFNLGVLLCQSGKNEEGEALFHHSVEVDPNYMYGHASIALTEAGMKHKQVALDHLKVVTQAEIIGADTAVVANLAWTILAIQKHDMKSAHQRFDSAVQVYPEHPLLERYRKILKEAERFENDSVFHLREELRSGRAHCKLLETPLTVEMDLRACLETIPKEMMVKSAFFLRTSASGKKAELVSRLTGILLDKKLLRQTLDEYLEKSERGALQWILRAGGVCPWKDFSAKYGDDIEELLDWKTYEPESLPGGLRMICLLFSGILKGKRVVFIPADLRPLLSNLLK